MIVAPASAVALFIAIGVLSPDPKPATFADRPVVATVAPEPTPSSTTTDAERQTTDTQQKAAAEAERKAAAAAEAKRKAAAEARRKAAAAEAKRKAAAEARRKADAAEAKRKAAAEAKRKAAAAEAERKAAQEEPATVYSNCDELTQDYPHGVGLPGATDQTRSGSDPVTTFKQSRALYEANSKSDRDNDGVACERT